MITTAYRFRAAIHRRDLATIRDLFTDDVRFYSPVKFAPFEGKPLVLGLFGVLLRTFEDFRYTGHLTGTAQTGSAGAESPAAVLPFRATVHGRQVQGIDLIHTDPFGHIPEFTVMLRPVSAIQAVSAAVEAGLIADGLATGPTSA